MNDRVVASMHSSGVQLELTALAWRRTSLSVLANVVLPWSTKFFDQSGPSHSISSSLAFAGAVVACLGCRPRGRDLATAHCAIGSPPKVMSGNATLRASRAAKSHKSGASHYVSAETRKAQIAAYHAKQAKPRGLRRLFSR
jgi:Domain of unknown function (DUF202)